MNSKIRSSIQGVLLGLLTLLIACTAAQAQGCYESLEAEGIRYLETGQYNEAVNSFFSAYRCTDRPRDHRIDELMQDVINQLRGVAEEAKEAARAAEQAKEAEAVARVAEQKAKELAEAKAEEAAQNARRAESLRLALLADLEREKAAYSTGLQLAFLAVELSDPDIRQNALNAFAKVVRDSFTQLLPTGEELVRVESHEGYLLVEDEEGLTIWKEADWSFLNRLTGYSHVTPVEGQAQLIVETNNGQNLEMYVMPNQQAIALRGQHGADLTYASATGDSYITSSRDHTSIIWDNTGLAKHQLNGHNGNVYEHLAWPGQGIVTRSSDGLVKLWSQEGAWQTDLASGKYVHDIEVSADGSVLAAASANGHLLYWVATASGRTSYDVVHGGSPVRKLRFLDSSGSRMLSIDVKGQLQFWRQGESASYAGEDLPQCIDFKVLEQPLEILAWDAKGACYLLNPDGKIVARWQLPESQLMEIAYAPSTQTLLSNGFGDQQYIRWWSRNGDQLLSWRRANTDPDQQAFFSTDGAYFVIANPSLQVIEVSPLPGNILEQIKAQDNFINRSALADFKIQVWPGEKEIN